MTQQNKFKVGDRVYLARIPPERKTCYGLYSKIGDQGIVSRSGHWYLDLQNERTNIEQTWHIEDCELANSITTDTNRPFQKGDLVELQESARNDFFYSTSKPGQKAIIERAPLYDSHPDAFLKIKRIVEGDILNWKVKDCKLIESPNSNTSTGTKDPVKVGDTVRLEINPKNKDWYNGSSASNYNTAIVKAFAGGYQRQPCILTVTGEYWLLEDCIKVSSSATETKPINKNKTIPLQELFVIPLNTYTGNGSKPKDYPEKAAIDKLNNQIIEEAHQLAATKLKYMFRELPDPTRLVKKVDLIKRTLTYSLY